MHTTYFNIGKKILLAGSLVLFASSQAMAFSEPQFQTAFQQFTQSAKGSEEAAANAFNELLKQDPASPLIMAYAGASTGKLATTTMFPWKKMSYAEDGMAMLEKALQLAAANENAQGHGSTPVILEVKYVAASTFLAVPAFMNRGARGAKLLNEVLEHKQFDKAETGFRGSVLMRAASLANEQKRPEDAKRYLNEVIKQNAPQAEAAKAMLKGIPS
jgi:tetratricopeptide (TPR) repeat protein